MLLMENAYDVIIMSLFVQYFLKRQVSFLRGTITALDLFYSKPAQRRTYFSGNSVCLLVRMQDEKQGERFFVWFLAM